MSIETAVFAVQRGDQQFSCKGSDLTDKVVTGDLFAIQRGDTPYKGTSDQVQDTDLLACTDTDGVSYKVTGAQFKTLLVPPLPPPPPPTPPKELVPLPDGVTLNLSKDMVVNKQSSGAGIIPHDPWITIDIRTSINTDDYLFCMCWPHFSGNGGDVIRGPNSDRDRAVLGYTINHPELKEYNACLDIYHAEYDGVATQWTPFESFSRPFGFSWDIGGHLSFNSMKKHDVAKCQPYIIAYPKTLLTFPENSDQAAELNGGKELFPGETANVPEGSYFIYFYYDAQQHWIVKDGLWQFGKSFKDARSNKWTDEDHAEMLDLAPMMVDITDWNFARVEK